MQRIEAMDWQAVSSRTGESSPEFWSFARKKQENIFKSTDAIMIVCSAHMWTQTFTAKKSHESWGRVRE